MCLSVYRGGTYPPWDHTLLGPYPPPHPDHTRWRPYPPGLYPQDRTHQLLTSSGSNHTYGRQAGDTHPTGMHSCLSVCFQSCSRKDRAGNQSELPVVLATNFFIVFMIHVARIALTLRLPNLMDLTMKAWWLVRCNK